MYRPPDSFHLSAAKYLDKHKVLELCYSLPIKYVFARRAF